MEPQSAKNKSAVKLSKDLKAQDSGDFSEYKSSLQQKVTNARHALRVRQIKPIKDGEKLYWFNKLAI
jgi:hypothetical protein